MTTDRMLPPGNGLIVCDGVLWRNPYSGAAV